MHIKPFRAVYPRLDYIDDPDAFFGGIREDFSGFHNNSFFKKPEGEVMFIYQIRNAGGRYTGLLACVDIRDYLEGHIRRHEHTLAAKEQKQMEMLLRRKAAIKPVLLAYPRTEAASGWMNRYIAGRGPDFEVFFSSEQERHVFWELSASADIQEIQAVFAAHVPNAYIADGHHRAATAARMYAQSREGSEQGGFSRLFCGFFPSSDIAILEFNRVVEGLNGHTAASFINMLSRYCEIERLPGPAKPSRQHEFTMLLGGEWRRLRWKESLLQEHAGERVVLDTSLLNEVVLAGALGITDIRSGQRVHYIEGPKGLGALQDMVGKRDDCAAFCLFPIQLEDMMALADRGRMLPPKSTWFEPRMKNGVVVQVLE